MSGNEASRPIRLGVIGLGLIAQSVHIPNITGPLAERFRIVHVCDLSPGLATAIGGELGARHGTDIEVLLNDPDVEAVLICTPGAHSPLARKALERGKHVFAEKPYSYDPAIAVTDQDFADQQGLVLQVGYMKMYEPALAAARARMAAIGPLRLVRMTVLHPSDENQTKDLSLKRFNDVEPGILEQARAEIWRDVRAALADLPGLDEVLFRNVLHGSVCHQVSVLRALFPDAAPEVISVHQDAPGSVRTEPPKLQIVGRLPGGPDWSISWNWLTHFPEYQEWLEIYGDHGSMRIDFPPPYLKGQSAVLTVTTSSAHRDVLTEQFDPRGATAFQIELAQFWSSIAERTPVLSSADGAGRDSHLLRRIATLASG
ncbi:MAG TPA: Gfo/Idh/MocA family oxidoreductase [Kaistia sp.]|nr:Gfo/Idh/MocA family oxidoreductase [Kaistia sp.]